MQIIDYDERDRIRCFSKSGFAGFAKFMTSLDFTDTRAFPGRMRGDYCLLNVT